MHEFKSMRRKYLQKMLNSNTKYVIAFILAIQIHRMARYLHTSKTTGNEQLFQQSLIICNS